MSYPRFVISAPVKFELCLIRPLMIML